MALEIEIKLSVEPSQAHRLWSILAQYPHPKPATQRLFSVYYDTPDHELRSSGVALRLRRQGKRWIQCVKSGGVAAAGLHRRTEHETVVAAQIPSFPAIIEAGFGKLMADKKMRAALQIAFTTDFRRSSTLISPRADTVIEVSLDRGNIAAGGRSEPICEVELELKKGSTGALFDLALAIAEALPSARLGHRSKAQRGYALADGLPYAPVKATTPPLSADMTVEDAFVAVALHCIAHLQDNEPGLLAGRDPEFLHQARIALRRLRSSFHVFDAAIPRTHWTQISEHLRALSRVLGAARELDVFATETLPQAGCAEHAGLAALRRQTQISRHRANQAARASVAAGTYTALLLQLARRITQGQGHDGRLPRSAAGTRLRTFAASFLSNGFERMAERGHDISPLDSNDIHRLRIRIKRLRYAVEFFMPLFESRARHGLRSLLELQALLGKFNDDAVAWNLLDALAGKDSSIDYQQGVGFVRGWCVRDAQLLRSQINRAWERFGHSKAWRKPS